VIRQTAFPVQPEVAATILLRLTFPVHLRVVAGIALPLPPQIAPQQAPAVPAGIPLQTASR